MNYPQTAATGHAGEFFFAYQIAKVLGWPCRVFDIDIGVDAQVEILDAKRESTGKFVAFQIKTTAGEGVERWYVRSRQLAYWQGLEQPVYLVLVDLTEESMYLHCIDRRKKYPKTRGGQFHIAFDRERGRFGLHSGSELLAAADAAMLRAVDVHLKRVRNATKAIESELAKGESDLDPEQLIELMRDRAQARVHLLRGGALARNSGVGLKQYKRVKRDLERALGRLRHAMFAWRMDLSWDHAGEGDGDIRRFFSKGESVHPDE